MSHKLYAPLSPRFSPFSLKDWTLHDETEQDGHNLHCQPGTENNKIITLQN